MNGKGNTYIVTFLIYEISLNNGIWFQNKSFIEDFYFRNWRVELRLVLSANRFFALFLLHRVVGYITNEQISTLSETYETDLACDFYDFNWEVARCLTRTLVYNISRVLHVPWRSISLLRMLKTNVRSTMNNDSY